MLEESNHCWFRKFGNHGFRNLGKNPNSCKKVGKKKSDKSDFPEKKIRQIRHPGNKNPTNPTSRKQKSDKSDFPETHPTNPTFRKKKSDKSNIPEENYCIRIRLFKLKLLKLNFKTFSQFERKKNIAFINHAKK